MTGEQRQEWTWRDIFRSIGLAFSFSRLVTGLLGLAVMAVADGLITWVAAFEVWSPEGSWAAWFGHSVLFYLKLVVMGYAFLFTATAIAYSAKGELLEGEGAGVKESIGFVFRKFGAIFLTPVLFWVYMGLMGLFAFVWYLLGLIPVAGPILYSLGFFFVFLFSILVGMGFLAFLFSFFLSPPIIAVRQEGALDAVLDTIDLMRGKGAFWVAMLAVVAAMLVGPIFIGRTLDVGYKLADMTMGEQFTETVKNMPREIQPRQGTYFARARQFWPGGYGGLWPTQWGTGWGYGGPGDDSTAYKVAGWILGIWVLLLAGFSISFTMGAFVSAGTLTYLIVREEEEFLEPVPAESPAGPSAPARQSEGKAEKEPAEKESAEKPREKTEDKAEKTGEESSEKRGKKASERKGKSKRKG